MKSVISFTQEQAVCPNSVVLYVLLTLATMVRGKHMDPVKKHESLSLHHLISTGRHLKLFRS